MVDGELPVRALLGLPWRIQALTPGDHVVAFQCGFRWSQPRGFNWSQPDSLCLRVFRVTVESGHVYRFMSQLAEIGGLKGANSRLIDVESGQDVGRMVSATGEPLIQSAPISVQSPFFVLERPLEEGWYVVQHNDTRLRLLKSGKNTDELYSITVRVFTIPPFNSRKDFITSINPIQNFVHTWEDYAFEDPNRYEVLADSATPFDGRPDFCVQTHRRFIEKISSSTAASGPGLGDIAVSRLMKSIGMKNGAPEPQPVPRPKPLVIESDGYVCRSSTNKNLAVSFEYSHRCHQGQGDGTTAVRAEAVFGRMKL